MTQIRITGGQVLLGEDGLATTDLSLSDGRIDAIGAGPAGKGLSLDATGLLVLPGIVDIHGDAFERQIQPRPGVDFPVGIALRDTERQLLANGITTAFHGVTLSWEPGLRSLDSWRAMMTALEAERWTCDMRVHLRWEAYNLDALDTALADIAAGRVHLLAFNDHTPSILKKLHDPVEGAKYAGRAGMKMEAFRAFTDRIAARAYEVPAALERIGAAARAANLPMASHDDDTLPRAGPLPRSGRAHLRVSDGRRGRPRRSHAQMSMSSWAARTWCAAGRISTGPPPPRWPRPGSATSCRPTIIIRRWRAPPSSSPTAAFSTSPAPGR